MVCAQVQILGNSVQLLTADGLSVWSECLCLASVCCMTPAVALDIWAVGVDLILKLFLQFALHRLY